MLRLFLIGFICYLAYRVLRRYLWPKHEGLPPKKAPDGIVDELVKDPVCLTYIPKASAYRLRFQGNEYFFCSEACAKQFVDNMDKMKEA